MWYLSYKLFYMCRFFPILSQIIFRIAQSATFVSRRTVDATTCRWLVFNLQCLTDSPENELVIFLQCYNCKHDFCWMCLGDWRSHGSEYYECSRYKVRYGRVDIEQTWEVFDLISMVYFPQENPNIANESAHAQAREALKKYLHYFERVRLILQWRSFISILFSGRTTLEASSSRLWRSKLSKTESRWDFSWFQLISQSLMLCLFRKRWMLLREPG